MGVNLTLNENYTCAKWEETFQPSSSSSHLSFPLLARPDGVHSELFSESVSFNPLAGGGGAPAATQYTT